MAPRTYAWTETRGRRPAARHRAREGAPPGAQASPRPTVGPGLRDAEPPRKRCLGEKARGCMSALLSGAGGVDGAGGP